jgi:segregation and condensation protein B
VESISSPVPDEPSPPPLERIIEALLFVGGPPLTVIRATEVVRGLDAEQLGQIVAALNRDYRLQGRPYHIQRRDQGYEMVLRPRYRRVREKMSGGPRWGRLSSAALDALALVAYHQPVTRQEVDSLRGGDSQALLRQLVRLGLVAVQRTEGKEPVYGTTPRFLQLFDLRSLEDLPRTADLQKM